MKNNEQPTQPELPFFNVVQLKVLSPHQLLKKATAEDFLRMMKRYTFQVESLKVQILTKKGIMIVTSSNAITRTGLHGMKTGYALFLPADEAERRVEMLNKPGRPSGDYSLN